MTDTRQCPGCQVGKLTSYGSRKRGIGTRERRRRCDCCDYADVLLLRPEEVLSLRLVQRRTNGQTQTNSTPQ